MIRRIVLLILLGVALGYAVYVYWSYLPWVAKEKPKPEIAAEAPSPEAIEAERERIEVEKIPEVKELVDPFALRISVEGKTEEVAKSEERGEVKKTAEPKLEGIWLSSGMRVAFISGQALRKGGVVMGWRVAEISKSQVVLQKGETTKVLRLEGMP